MLTANNVVRRRVARFAVLAGASIAALAISAPSMAEASESANSEVSGGDIIVSARKREESILQTPVIVQAISAEQLTNQNISDIKSLTSLSPGLIITDAFALNGAQVFIRGIGNTGGVTDQSVGLTVDGFSSSSGSIFNQGMFDVNQVEVLKGPQSLFFGKSTSGGVISITSKDPTDKFEMGLQSGYEVVADELRLNGYVSTPLSDKLGVRVAGYYNTMKGWMVNLNPTNTKRVPHTRDFGGRVTFKFDDPDAGLRVKLKLGYTDLKRDDTSSSTAQLICSEIPVGWVGENCRTDNVNQGIPQIKPYIPNGDFTAFTGTSWATGLPDPRFRNGKEYSSSKTALGVLSVDLDVSNGLTLSSVTSLAWVKVAEAGIIPSVFGDLALATDPSNNEFSQEVRLTSDWSDKPVNFMIGGLYNPGSKTPNIFVGYPNNTGPFAAFLNNTYTNNRAKIKSVNYGVFGQVIVTPTDKLEIAAGARYSKVTRRWTKMVPDNNFGLPQNGTNTIPLITPSLVRYSEHRFTPDLSVSYKPDQDKMFFVSYKKGYKGPTWNTPFTTGNFNDAVWQSNPAVPGEDAEGFEGGFKGRLADGQITLNLVGYRYNYKNLQVVFRDNTKNLQIIGSGANARVQGVELELAARPAGVPGLSLNAFVNYNDTYYTSYAGAPCYSNQTVSAGCVADGDGNKNQDLTGKQLPYAPKWSVVLGADYEWDLNSTMKASISVQGQYSDSYGLEFTNTPVAQQGSYTLLNLAAHLKSADDKWDVAILCRNCTNKYYGVFGGDNGTDPLSALVGIARRRQLALQLTVRPDLF